MPMPDMHSALAPSNLCLVCLFSSLRVVRLQPASTTPSPMTSPIPRNNVSPHPLCLCSAKKFPGVCPALCLPPQTLYCPYAHTQLLTRGLLVRNGSTPPKTWRRVSPPPCPLPMPQSSTSTCLCSNHSLFVCDRRGHPRGDWQPNVHL